MEDLGINLAGVEIILRMTRRITELQQQLEELKVELSRRKQGDT
jgi:hypothetical protein|tara:strand:+ start:288 stop:419 length:132 start_codon:yes stop_codon:yes gene_type:complete